MRPTGGLRDLLALILILPNSWILRIALVSLQDYATWLSVSFMVWFLFVTAALVLESNGCGEPCIGLYLLLDHLYFSQFFGRVALLLGRGFLLLKSHSFGI